jgi:hypothetical protein
MQNYLGADIERLVETTRFPVLLWEMGFGTWCLRHPARVQHSHPRVYSQLSGVCLELPPMPHPTSIRRTSALQIWLLLQI